MVADLVDRVRCIVVCMENGREEVEPVVVSIAGAIVAAGVPFWMGG